MANALKRGSSLSESAYIVPRPGYFCNFARHLRADQNEITGQLALVKQKKGRKRAEGSCNER